MALSDTGLQGEGELEPLAVAFRRGRFVEFADKRLPIGDFETIRIAEAGEAMKRRDLQQTLEKWQKRFGPDIIKNAKYRETEYGPSQSVEQALKLEAEVKKGLK